MRYLIAVVIAVLLVSFSTPVLADNSARIAELQTEFDKLVELYKETDGKMKLMERRAGQINAIIGELRRQDELQPVESMPEKEEIQEQGPGIESDKENK